MAQQAIDDRTVPSAEHVTFSGTVRGGSGWNDPPLCQYDQKSVMTQRGYHQLNRRVGHTIGRALSEPGSDFSASNASNQPASVVSGIQLYPPTVDTDPALYVAPIIVPTMSIGGGTCSGPTAMNPVTSSAVAVLATNVSDDLDVPQFEDDEQMFHYVVTRLQRALVDIRITSNLRACEEMEKKVNIFSDMWKSGKISYPVRSAMARLATAIHKRRCDIADKIQASLMVDHVSEVSRWLVGVKRLIHEVRQTDAPISPSSNVVFTAPAASSRTERTDLVQVPQAIPVAAAQSTPPEVCFDSTQQVVDGADIPSQGESPRQFDGNASVIDAPIPIASLLADSPRERSPVIVLPPFVAPEADALPLDDCVLNHSDADHSASAGVALQHMNLSSGVPAGSEKRPLVNSDD